MLDPNRGAVEMSSGGDLLSSIETARPTIPTHLKGRCPVRPLCPTRSTLSRPPSGLHHALLQSCSPLIVISVLMGAAKLNEGVTLPQLAFCGI